MHSPLPLRVLHSLPSLTGSFIRRICPSLLPFVTLHKKIIIYSDELFVPYPTPKLEDHPLSAVHDCLFSIFAGCLLHSQPEDRPSRAESYSFNVGTDTNLIQILRLSKLWLGDYSIFRFGICRVRNWLCYISILQRRQSVKSMKVGEGWLTHFNWLSFGFISSSSPVILTDHVHITQLIRCCIHFKPTEGVSMFHLNVGINLKDHKVSQSGRPYSEQILSNLQIH
jgi:hypothetical protein